MNAMFCYVKHFDSRNHEQQRKKSKQEHEDGDEDQLMNNGYSFFFQSLFKILSLMTPFINSNDFSMFD